MDKLINDIVSNYLLHETIENEDYPLYHRCGLNKLYQILKYNKLDSRYWDREHCISCTRSKSFVVENTSPKYVNITFNIHKLKAHNRNIYIRNFSWKYKSDEFYEYEERICNRKDKEKPFTIPYIDDCIDRIDLLIDHINYDGMEQEWNEIFELLKHSSLYNKTFFTTNRKEWKKGITRNSYHISQFDVIERGISEKDKKIGKEGSNRAENIKYIEALYDDEDLNAQLRNAKTINDLDKLFDNVCPIEGSNLIKVSKWLERKNTFKYNLLKSDDFQLVLPIWVDEIGNECDSNGYITIEADDKFNRVRNNGNLLWNKPHNEWFDAISSRSRDGFYRVDIGNRHNYLSINGEILLKDWYDWVSPFKNGYGRITNDDMKENYVDTKGSILSPDLWFDMTYPFKGEFAKIEIGDKCNFIKTDGSILSPDLWFDDGASINVETGLGMVELQGKRFYIDVNGKLTKIGKG